MTTAVELLELHGLRFALGSTLLLAGAALAVQVSRSPVRVQRIGELGIGLALLWPLFALIPFPRPRVIERVVPEAVLSIPAPATQSGVERVGDRKLEPTTPLALGSALGPESPGFAASPPVTPAGAGRGSARILAWLFVWGAALRAAWLALGVLCLAWTVRRSSPAARHVQRLAADLGCDPRTARIRVSDRIRPFCAPYLRPVILLPASLCRPGQEETLRAVLLHELAHLRRRDLIGEGLCAVASPLLFWNPLFWWLHRRARQSSELLADEIATSAMDKSKYVRALIRLAESTLSSRRAVAGALFAIEFRNDFHRRIKMLIQRQSKLDAASGRLHTVVRHALAAAALVGLGLTLGIPAARASHATPDEVSAFAPATESHRYVVGLEYDDQATLGKLVTHLVRGGHPVEVLQVEEPTADVPGWRATFAIEDGGTEFPRRLSETFGKIEGASLLKLKRSSTGTPSASEAAITLVAKDKDIRELVSELAALASANVVISPDVVGQVTVAFEKAPWRTALEASTDALGYVVEDAGSGILIVKSGR